MEEFDIPIFKKTYDMYKTFYGYRNLVPRQDRFALWQRTENAILDMLEAIMIAGQKRKQEKSLFLEKASSKLNLLRVFLRLMKEVKIIDNKKYVALEESVDEIGRMLGGWLKSVREP